MERPDSELAQALGAKENFRSKSLGLKKCASNDKKTTKKHFGRVVPSSGMAGQPRGGDPSGAESPNPHLTNKKRKGSRQQVQGLEQKLAQTLQRERPVRAGQARQG